MELSLLSKIRKTVTKTGMPPGTLIHVGEKKVDQATIEIIDYDENQFEKTIVPTIEACLKYTQSPTVTWINVIGLHDTELIEDIGRHFDIHPLVLEDIIHTGQRSKIEDFENYLFTVIKVLKYDSDTGDLVEEQLSIITSENFVITFQETPSDIFDPLVKRISHKSIRIRKRRSDYLTYAILDTIVDNYFLLIEQMGEEIEEMDAYLMAEISRENLQAVFNLKKKIISIRKCIWPLQEMINGIYKDEYSMINEPVVIYFRDIHDHLIQIVDTIETYRDTISSMIDTHLSILSMKMNQVMKVLTVFAAVFMPLTFIAGIYGMNFRFMPELEWRWGYFTVWSIMIVISIFMLLFFKFRKWM